MSTATDSVIAGKSRYVTGISQAASVCHAPSFPRARARRPVNAIGKEAIVSAAAGDGSPLNEVWEHSSSVSTLNLASRKSAQSEKRQAVTHKSLDGYSKNGWNRSSRLPTPEESAS